MASVVAFGPLADTCQRFLSKGRQVYVEGRLTTRQYEAKDGSGKRYRTEIVARQLRMLGNRARTRPRLKHPTTSRFSSHHATGEPRKRFSLNYPNHNRRLRKWTSTQS